MKKYDNLEQLMEESHNDLISIANSDYNLGVSKKFTKEQLARMILSAQNSGQYRSDIEVLRGEQSKEPEKQELPPGYCILRLQRSPSNKEGWPVIYGLQGKTGLLPVGKNFKAPEYIIEILSNALKEEVVQDSDSGEEHSFKTHAYPFTVIKHNPSEKWPMIERNIDKNTDVRTDMNMVA